MHGDGLGLAGLRISDPLRYIGLTSYWQAHGCLRVSSQIPWLETRGFIYTTI